MNEVIEYTSYAQYKERLDTVIQRQVEDFVETGYLLKVARDTNVLYESGYKSVAEFAQAEYGLSKDTVSRYIAINDRYSVGGYSKHLQDSFQRFGYAKLADMLTLSVEVVESLSSDLTRKEIQDIKREIKEEQQISDVEVMLEGQKEDQRELTLLQKVLHQYFYENKEDYLRLAAVIRGEMSFEESVREIMEDWAAPGTGVKITRIRGIGKLILTIKGEDRDIILTNVRTNEIEEIAWGKFIDSFGIFGGKAGKTEWEEVYGESFEEEKTKVAPVQQKNEVKEIETHQVSESPTLSMDVSQSLEKSIPQQEESTTTEGYMEEIVDKQDEIVAKGAEHVEMQEENIPGQKTIEDYPEYLPDSLKEERIDPAEEEKKKIREMKSCASNSLSDLNTSFKAGGYKAALADAEHLVSYLKTIIELERE